MKCICHVVPKRWHSLYTVQIPHTTLEEKKKGGKPQTNYEFNTFNNIKEILEDKMQKNLTL